MIANLKHSQERVAIPRPQFSHSICAEGDNDRGRILKVCALFHRYHKRRGRFCPYDTLTSMRNSFQIPGYVVRHLSIKPNAELKCEDKLLAFHSFHVSFAGHVITILI